MLKGDPKYPFKCRNVHTVHNVLDTLSFLGAKMWIQLPNDIKVAPSLSIIQKKMKLWTPENC